MQKRKHYSVSFYIYVNMIYPFYLAGVLVGVSFRYPITRNVCCFSAKMSETGWVVDDVFELLQLLGCIRTDKLQQHNCAKYVKLHCSYTVYLIQCLRVPQEIDVLIIETFNNNFGIENDFTQYLKLFVMFVF